MQIRSHNSRILSRRINQQIWQPSTVQLSKVQRQQSAGTGWWLQHIPNKYVRHHSSSQAILPSVRLNPQKMHKKIENTFFL